MKLLPDTKRSVYCLFEAEPPSSHPEKKRRPWAADGVPRRAAHSPGDAAEAAAPPPATRNGRGAAAGRGAGRCQQPPGPSPTAAFQSGPATGGGRRCPLAGRRRPSARRARRGDSGRAGPRPASDAAVSPGCHRRAASPGAGSGEREASRLPRLPKRGEKKPPTHTHARARAPASSSRPPLLPLSPGVPPRPGLPRAPFRSRLARAPCRPAAAARPSRRRPVPGGGCRSFSAAGRRRRRPPPGVGAGAGGSQGISGSAVAAAAAAEVNSSAAAAGGRPRRGC